jgi:hypothetical protein
MLVTPLERPLLRRQGQYLFSVGQTIMRGPRKAGDLRSDGVGSFWFEGALLGGRSSKKYILHHDCSLIP